MRTPVDVRTPADPQDFQTATQRPPRPPRDFKVMKTPDGSAAVMVIKDWQEAGNRQLASGFKVYFAPLSVGSSVTIGTRTNNAAAFRTATPVGDARASFRGGLIQITNSTLANLQGWYFCVSTNQDGQESLPNGPVPSPWNQ